jgi:hypothetical protein
MVIVAAGEHTRILAAAGFWRNLAGLPETAIKNLPVQPVNSKISGDNCLIFCGRKTAWQ